jgi:hypothetical protein
MVPSLLAHQFVWLYAWNNERTSCIYMGSNLRLVSQNWVKLGVLVRREMRRISDESRLDLRDSLPAKTRLT